MVRKIKSIFISLFIALLAFVNIAFYSVDAKIPISPTRTTNVIDTPYLIGYNHCYSNPNAENTYHSCFEQLCKYSNEINFKLPYLKDFSEDTFYFIKELHYFNSSNFIPLCFDSPDIIFPFHYFW